MLPTLGSRLQALVETRGKTGQARRTRIQCIIMSPA